MNTPLQISVIICTYNRAAYIPEALKSLSEQTLSKESFEVIVVNNNSTDDTEEVCKNCIARFATTHISYTNELNQGLPLPEIRVLNLHNRPCYVLWMMMRLQYLIIYIESSNSSGCILMPAD